MASKPLPQQSGEVRQRHIERVISPASPVSVYMCVCVCVCVAIDMHVHISMAVCVYVCKLQGCVVCALVLLDRQNPRRSQWPVTGPSGSPSCSWCWPLWWRSLLGTTT